MIRRMFGALLIGLQVACVSLGARPDARIAVSLEPSQRELPPVGGESQPVAAFRDASGLAGEFVEGFLLVRPRSDEELQGFLARYGGRVVQDNRLPPLSPAFGITLTDAQRAPTEYLVRIDLARADLSRFGRLAGRAGWEGTIEFSSDAGLRTFVTALEARDQGFVADANFVYDSHQTFPAAPPALPLTLLSSTERPVPATDAFQQALYGATAAGSPANVILAWQFLAAHGVQRQVRVAIIDDGFYLTNAGQPIPGDSDYAANPLQIDLVRGTAFADGMGAGICGGNPCPWHGTGAAGVAVGVLNNNQGTAGTGAVIGVPILVKVGRSRADKNRGIRAAIMAGADVVSMSWGTACDSVACRQYDRGDTPFDDLAGSANRPVFVASAGNGEGGNGYEVGAPKFQHPCIEDHVICVGAVNTPPANAVNRIQYSNFGARVDVFAPTNIPVMSYPDGSGTVGPRTFGGTSASCPYVAGIAAMIKAIDPSLGSDQVAAILRETARPGTGDVARVVDALAAVRRAAQPFAMVKDRHEPNSIESAPTTLAPAAAYTENNLNLDPGDRDLFRFTVPSGSMATFTLRYASGLGAVSIVDLHGDGGPCAEPALVSDTAQPDGTGRDTVYRLAGGPHLVELRANALLAYNLGITFALPAIPADRYEPNDTAAQARTMRSPGFTPAGGLLQAISPRFTADATIHHAADVDFYIVRGVDLGGKTFGLTGTHIVFSAPAVKVYGNDSSIDVQVFRLNADDTAGPLVQHLTATSCAPEALVVPLEANALYLVRVSGSPGRCTLENGVDTSSRRHPFKQRDRLYEVLHPGEPVEHAVRYTQYYVLPPDREFTSILSDDPRLHFRLLEPNGAVVREGRPSGTGELLSFGDGSGRTRLLEVARRDRGDDAPVLHLAWSGPAARRASGNLLQNPSGEEVGVDGGLAGWSLRDGVAPARGVVAAGLLREDEHAARERTARLFAAAEGAGASGLRQVVRVPEEWRRAVDEARVRLRLSALLGGRGRGATSAAVRVGFLDANGRPLGGVAIPPVGARDRDGGASLIPAAVQGDPPPHTAFLVVDLEFAAHADRTSAAFADDVQLTLSEFPGPAE